MEHRLNQIIWYNIDDVHICTNENRNQIVLLYKPAYKGQCFLEYTTSNNQFALLNAKKEGYTQVALIVDQGPRV
jgi:hypothetical protein